MYKKLFSYIKKIFKKATGEYRKNIYHELGHVVFAYILNSYFDYEKIELNKETLKRIGDEEWLAAAKIQGRNPGATSAQIEYRIHAIIIAFSGMCSQSALSEKFTKLKNMKANWISSPDKYMDTSGGDGDMDIIAKKIKLVLMYVGMEYSQFRIKIFEIIINILMQKEIYEGLKQCANDIISSTEKTISKDELNSMFKKYGIENIINDNYRSEIRELILRVFPYEKDEEFDE